MDTINNGIRFINSSIDTCTDYVKDNALQIVIILALVYYLRNKAGKMAATGHTLKEGNATEQVQQRTRDQDIQLVRQRQQEIANERAKQAAILRKEKERKVRERKNTVAKNKKKTISGDKLGGSSDGEACSYNPMQPGASHSTGYRPARRTVRKG